MLSAAEIASSAGSGAWLAFRAAVAHDRGGATGLAGQAYEEAVRLAKEAALPELAAEALWRLALVRHHGGHPEEARRFGLESCSLARSVPDPAIEAQSLNVMAGLQLEWGHIGEAGALFQEALGLARHREDLVAKIEQNLGIVANVQGDVSRAEAHYRKALKTYQRLGDVHGVAIALHNLGMLAADNGGFAAAEELYSRALESAQAGGDRRLAALCHLNRAEVLIRLQRYTDAWDDGHAAQVAFSTLGTMVDEADALRVLGILFREMGRLAMADWYLSEAVAMARQGGIRLTEAESYRELARLRFDQGRAGEALTAMSAACDLFRQIGAAPDLSEAEACLARLG